MPRRNTQLVQLPIAEGMDAGVDPKIGEIPIIIENGVYKRRGAISKRPGQDSGGIGNFSLGGIQLATYEDGCLAIGGTGPVYVMDSALNQTASASTNASPCSVNIVPRRQEYSSIIGVDAVKAAGYIGVITLNDTISMNVTSYDLENLAQIDTATYGSATAGGVFVEQGVGTGGFRFYWLEGATLASNVFTAAGAIGTKITKGITAASLSMDACLIENSGGNFNAAVVYHESGTGYLKVIFCDSGLFSTTVTATVSTAASIQEAVGIYPVSDTECVIAWVEESGATANLRAGVWDVSGSNTVAVATVRSWNNTTEYLGDIHHITGILTNPGGGDLGTIFLSTKETSAAFDGAFWVLIDEIQNSGGTVATVQSTGIPRAKLVTKPMSSASGGPVMIGVYTESWSTTVTSETKFGSNKFVWLNHIESGGVFVWRPVGKSSIGIATEIQDLSGGSTEPLGVLPGGTDSSLFVALPTITRVDFEDWFNPAIVSWTISTYDITYPQFPISVIQSFDRGYAIMSSSVAHYIAPGNFISECGFLQTPESIAPVDAAAGSLGAGTYSFKAVYEETDAAGNRHQSAPTSVAASVTIGASRRIDVTVPNLTLTYRISPLTTKIVLYMNDGAGGTIYRRAVEASNASTSSETTIQVNAAPSATDERLYTHGGELANEDWQPHTVSAIWQGRYFLFDTDNKVIRYSKFRVPGEPFNMNDVLSIDIDLIDGDITAMAVMSDKLVCFKRSSIYVLEPGGGLDDTGGGVNYSEPYLVSTAVGCIDQRSVVRIPQGIMFESENGIQLLSSSLQIQPIGDPIRYFIETDGPITGNAHLKDNQYVVLSTLNGSALVYNWFFNKWSTWSNFTSKSITSINGDTQVARANETASEASFVTDVTNFDDSGSYVGLRIRTGWISRSGSSFFSKSSPLIGGWYRLKEIVIVGQNLAAHTLRIKIAYDHESNASGPIWVDDDTITPTTLTDFAHTDYYDAGTSTTQTANAYLLRYQPSHSKCTSFMIELSDEQDSGQTEGWDISAISLLVQPHPVPDVVHVGAARQITG